MQNTKYSKAAGFSLIEILIALFFVGALTTMLISSSRTLFTTRSGRNQAYASRVASKDIEYLRNLTFASLPLTGSCTTQYQTDNDFTKLPTGATCQRTRTDYQPGSTEIQYFTVTVSWKEDTEKQLKPITLDTLIYEKGL